jgi:hypothetical protein
MDFTTPEFLTPKVKAAYDRKKTTFMKLSDCTAVMHEIQRRNNTIISGSFASLRDY